MRSFIVIAHPPPESSPISRYSMAESYGTNAPASCFTDVANDKMAG